MKNVSGGNPAFPPSDFRRWNRAMKWLAVFAAISIFALAGCDGEKTGELPDTAPETVVETPQGIIAAVGDSLTAGLGVDEKEAYPALLEKKLRAHGFRFKVINAGVSGETSSGTLSRIKWVISSLKPDIIILETGANDGLRGIDPEIPRENLDRIISLLKQENITVILVGMQMLPNLGPEYTQSFSKIYPEIAGKHDVAFIPFFLKGVAGEPGLNQPDRIHPTPEGYALIVENIYPFIEDVVEKHLSES
jgi:acyl-CoA thioesterase-1